MLIFKSPKPLFNKILKTRKKLCSQIIYEKMKMRALCSKSKNPLFRPNPRPAFGKWTFINVQKPFTALRPEPIFFFHFYICV